MVDGERLFIGWEGSTQDRSDRTNARMITKSVFGAKYLKDWG
jgi:hypothetical protein